MIWVLLTVVAVLLVGVFAGMLAGRIGYDPLAEPVTSQPEVGLAEGFTARSISDLRFDTALRGYRMDQVDRVLDALQDRIADQERRLAELGADGHGAGGHGAGGHGAGEPTSAEPPSAEVGSAGEQETAVERDA